MVIDSASAHDASLPQLLAHRARHASDARLATDLGGGLAVAAALALWRPAGWVLLLSAALCFASFGGWGIADRELGERSASVGQAGASARALEVARVAAGAVGGIAAVTLILGVLRLALGTWIS